MRSIKNISSKKAIPPTIALVLAASLFVIMRLTAFSQTAGNSGDAQIVIYVEPAEPMPGTVEVELSSLSISGRPGDFELPLRHTSFNITAGSGRQMFLAQTAVPSGDYSSLVFTFGKIKIMHEGEIVEPAGLSENVTVAINAHIPKESAQVIFLKWSPEINFDEDGQMTFVPRFRLMQNNIPPSGGLIFVANEGSDNLTIIDRFTYSIVDVVKTGMAPRGMVYSRLNRQLYVANSGDNSIVVIDLNTLQTLRTILLRYGDEPNRMALSPDEQQLYIVNHGSNTLSVYDTQSFQEIDRVTLGMTPTAIAVDRVSGYVYISNLNSESISIYQPIEQSIMSTLSVGGSPSEIAIDDRDKVLYLAFDRQRKTSFIDLRTGNNIGSLNICSSAAGMAYHRGSRQLYAAMGDCSEIAIIKPENGLKLGEIMIPGRPGLITLDPENRFLLAVIPDENKLAVINAVNREIMAQVEVGIRPYMAIVPE